MLKRNEINDTVCPRRNGLLSSPIYRELKGTQPAHCTKGGNRVLAVRASRASTPTIPGPPRTSNFSTRRPPDPSLVGTYIRYNFYLAAYPDCQMVNGRVSSPQNHVCLVSTVGRNRTPLSPTTIRRFSSYLNYLTYAATYPSKIRCSRLVTTIQPRIRHGRPQSLPRALVHALVFGLFPCPGQLQLATKPLCLCRGLNLSGLIRDAKLLTGLSPGLTTVRSLLPPIATRDFQSALPRIIPTTKRRHCQINVLLNYIRQIFFSSIGTTATQILDTGNYRIIVPHRRNYYSTLPTRRKRRRRTRTLTHRVVSVFRQSRISCIVVGTTNYNRALGRCNRVLRSSPSCHSHTITFSTGIHSIRRFLTRINLATPLRPLARNRLPVIFRSTYRLVRNRGVDLRPHRLLHRVPNIALQRPVSTTLYYNDTKICGVLRPRITRRLNRVGIGGLATAKTQLVTSPGPNYSLRVRGRLTLRNRAVPLIRPVRLLSTSVQKQSLSSLLNATRTGL